MLKAGRGGRGPASQKKKDFREKEGQAAEMKREKKHG